MTKFCILFFFQLFYKNGPGPLNITFGSDIPITVLHLMLMSKICVVNSYMKNVIGISDPSKCDVQRTRSPGPLVKIKCDHNLMKCNWKKKQSYSTSYIVGRVDRTGGAEGAQALPSFLDSCSKNYKISQIREENSFFYLVVPPHKKFASVHPGSRHYICTAKSHQGLWEQFFSISFATTNVIEDFQWLMWHSKSRFGDEKWNSCKHFFLYIVLQITFFCHIIHMYPD